jgi:hypothetical protein
MTLSPILRVSNHVEIIEKMSLTSDDRSKGH